MIKQIKNAVGVSEVLLSIYISYTLTIAYTLELCLMLGNKKTILFMVISFFAIFIISIYPSHKLIRFLEKKWFENKAIASNNSFLIFMHFLVPVLLVLSISFIKNYPGVFSTDANNMIAQAISGNYNDWHPVLYTLVAFTIPLKISGGNKAAIVIFQIIEFSCAISFMGCVMSRYSRKYAILSVVLIVLNPLTLGIVVRPWKDVGFAITTIVLVTFALIITSDSKWKRRKTNIILISVFVVLTTFFRHNGILFTIPYIIAICLKLDKKERITLVGLIVSFYLIIKFFVYPLLGVTAPGHRVVELSGMPMQIIGNVVAFDSGAISQELADFAYSVAPKDIWPYFITGNFNAMKASDFVNLDVIESAGILNMLRYTMLAFKASPARAIEGMLTSFVMVTSFTGPVFNWGTDFLDWTVYSLINNSMLRYVFLLVGTPMILSIMATLSKCDFVSRDGWFKFLLCLSLVLYNFGTMLLLTGLDYRFFYFTFTIAPALIMTMFVKCRGDNS